jgi:predicted nuclease of predicted toxin-antitoxin system
MGEADDSTIWNHALAANATIITKDEDFAERTSRTAIGPVIVWLRVGNTTNKHLLAWIELRWPSLLQLLNDGHQLIEVK